MQAPPNALRLNLGAGRVPLLGYANVDRSYANGFDMHESGGDGTLHVTCEQAHTMGLDLEASDVYPLPGYADGSVAEVRASHILEHFGHRETTAILTEWIRVLAPGGVLKIAVPDFRFIAEHYIAQTDALPIEAYCMGGQVDGNDFHAAIFDDPTLRRLLSDAGLVDIERWESEIEDCASLPVSLNLMGRKPGHCTHEGIGLPGCPVYDCRTVSEGGTRPDVESSTQSYPIDVDGWESAPAGWAASEQAEQYRGFGIATLPSDGHREFLWATVIAPDGSIVRRKESHEDALQSARDLIDSIHDGFALRNHPAPPFAGIEIPKGTVVPVLTCPRLGFTAYMHCALRAFVQLGLNAQIQGGAYWHQGMEEVISAAIADPKVRYILTTDYDTVFDHRDVEALYGIMDARPDIGAVFPLQMRRESITALLTLIDPETGLPMGLVDRSKFETVVQPAATGHFGLTLIRADCLRSTPKPWFMPKPAPDGGWGEGHTDADVMFWDAFRSAGHTIYLANRVVAGHLELKVTWPDINLEPIVQHVSDNYADGRPAKETSPIWR